MNPLTVPYVINLKNTTDEKLYDVNIFDFNFENQNKIKYEFGYKAITYKQFIRTLEFPTVCEIDYIKIWSQHGYKVYQERQINNFTVHYDVSEFKNGEYNGSFSQPLYFYFEDNQFSRDFTNLRLERNIKISLQNEAQIKDKPQTIEITKFTLDFLMPEINLKIVLFPAKINHDITK